MLLWSRSNDNLQYGQLCSLCYSCLYCCGIEYTCEHVPIQIVEVNSKCI
uniref:Uncharacterized protein n=1 Tax=Rhizophora mucronata TaxID=61149 RepID=A0A2P2NVJ8_RHIMU